MVFKGFTSVVVSGVYSKGVVDVESLRTVTFVSQESLPLSRLMGLHVDHTLTTYYVLDIDTSRLMERPTFHTEDSEVVQHNALILHGRMGGTWKVSGKRSHVHHRTAFVTWK